jgi:hypothetical protein
VVSKEPQLLDKDSQLLFWLLNYSSVLMQVRNGSLQCMCGAGGVARKYHKHTTCVDKRHTANISP